ncbi:MAG: DUF6553 family protein [Pygmaiobacter massiliensis]|uniref:DUF6553 family protein n=1 Tax=Pygmaiobacter massiliensis TaxID=1917873 RepID=UPI002896B4B0|nr:DUF6553 family protein [Pygmaiobacter massiliensis]
MTEQEYAQWKNAYGKEYRLKARYAMLEEALQEDKEHQQEHLLRLRFWQQRYGDQPAQAKLPDRYVGVWMDMLYSATNGSGWFGKKRLTRELTRNLTALGVEIAEESACAEEMLYEELCAMMRFYIYTCTKDGKYGSQLFGTMPLGEEKVMGKIADEITRVTRELPKQAGLSKEYTILYKAAKTAFEETFPGETLAEETK